MNGKIFITILFLMSFCFTAVQAQEDSSKGASEQAYEHASDKAVFHRVSDWFSTVGKPEEEKEKILADRAAKREMKKSRKQAREQVQEEQEASEDQAREMKRKQERRLERSMNQVRERSQDDTQGLRQGTGGLMKGHGSSGKGSGKK